MIKLFLPKNINLKKINDNKAYLLFQEQAPKVFVIEEKSETSKGDIVRYVRKWNRFTEIIVVLNASLREIEDRWASGKGPLALLCMEIFKKVSS